jgi:hypothetical protein
MNPLIAPSTETKYNIISLGAGVQSSCMALMLAKGEITPMPDFAIFADTQDEPESVYKWLDYLKTILPFEVYIVTRGKLSDSALKMRVTSDGRKFSTTSIPLFSHGEDGTVGKIGYRSCTSEYKIKPIVRKLRELCAIKRGQKTISVTQYIGISWDEWHRCKPSRDKWMQSRWPLIEMKMNRDDCILWMNKNGYPTPPRSSCVYCPFHSDAEWLRLKNQDPEAFKEAIDFEMKMQKAKENPKYKSIPYLHKSCKPLGEIEFNDGLDKNQLDLFGANHPKCEEGMCGV